MHRSPIVVLLSCALLAGCDEATAPLPRISGAYAYTASSTRYLDHNRAGVIVINDENRRSASFGGSFEYTDGRNNRRSGRLIGAFVDPGRIWFRLLTDEEEYHEASWAPGLATGEIYLKSPAYLSTRSAFTLKRPQ